MKLRWYDRILVALGGLVLVALGAVIILGVGGVIPVPEQLALDSWLGDGWQWVPLAFFVGFVIVIWGLWLLIRPFRRGSEPGGKYYTLQDDTGGNVRISVHAIDHLVRKCIDHYAQVLSAKIRIGGSEDAMRITLHMTLHSDVRIPSLVDELRSDIKRSLQTSAGVTVETVEIYIDATKDDKGAEVKLLEERARSVKDEPIADPINTASFYTAPIVVTEDVKPEPPITADEPTVAELKKEIDLGPDEPLPVELSEQAFPFPEEEAGVPLQIYTEDVPIEGEDEDMDAEKADTE